MELAQWLKQNSINSQVVVITSNYHAARAHSELRASLPSDLKLSFVLVNNRINTNEWLVETAKLSCSVIPWCDTPLQGEPLKGEKTRPAIAGFGS